MARAATIISATTCTRPATRARHIRWRPWEQSCRATRLPQRMASSCSITSPISCRVRNVRRPAADVDVLRQWCRLAVERHDGYHEPVLFGPLEPRIRHLHGGIPGGQSTSVNLHEDDTVSTQWRL